MTPARAALQCAGIEGGCYLASPTAQNAARLAIEAGPVFPMETTTLPTLAITMGDPSGIGPEIVLKAVRDDSVHAACRPVVVGDLRILNRAAEWIAGPCPVIEAVQYPRLARVPAGATALVDLRNAAPGECPPGEVGGASGAAPVAYVMAACDMVLHCEVDGMMTAPLNKEAMRKAGFSDAGQPRSSPRGLAQSD